MIFLIELSQKYPDTLNYPRKYNVSWKKIFYRS